MSLLFEPTHIGPLEVKNQLRTFRHLRVHGKPQRRGHGRTRQPLSERGQGRGGPHYPRLPIRAP